MGWSTKTVKGDPHDVTKGPPITACVSDCGSVCLRSVRVNDCTTSGNAVVCTGGDEADWPQDGRTMSYLLIKILTRAYAAKPGTPPETPETYP